MKVPEGGCPIDPNNTNEGEMGHTWRPWEQIYAVNKVTNKGLNFPAYNPHGKYVIKLYWMVNEQFFKNKFKIIVDISV